MPLLIAQGGDMQAALALPALQWLPPSCVLLQAAMGGGFGKDHRSYRPDYVQRRSTRRALPGRWKWLVQAVMKA